MIKERLSTLAPDRVRFGAALAGLTTYGLGGPAAALAEPETVGELSALLEFARQSGVPVFVLGGGSNVLFKDGGFEGLVVRLGGSFAGILSEPAGIDRVRLTVGAAEFTARLLAHTRSQGLTGLEFLAGIPGRVGGALAMNAGTVDGQILDAAVEIEVLDPDGRVRRVTRSELEAGYRRLSLPPGTVILKGIFILDRDNAEAVNERIERILERRFATQPMGVRSAGCVFRNPEGDFAGRLIDRAGLKGRRIGQAWVAEEHANFIVHKGEATARDVLALMEEIRRTVADRYGVNLESEIIVAGHGGESE